MERLVQISVEESQVESRPTCHFACMAYGCAPAAYGLIRILPVMSGTDTMSLTYTPGQTVAI